MVLTIEQQQALAQGEAITVLINNIPCVIVRQDIYDADPSDMDYSPMTEEEMDLLAAETIALLEGDGLDEPLDP